jgi:hypothetical protein
VSVDVGVCFNGEVDNKMNNDRDTDYTERLARILGVAFNSNICKLASMVVQVDEWTWLV